MRGMSNGMKTRSPFYRSSSIAARVLRSIINIFIFHSEVSKNFDLPLWRKTSKI